MAYIEAVHALFVKFCDDSGLSHHEKAGWVEEATEVADEEELAEEEEQESEGED